MLKLTESFEYLGNPFTEDSEELLSLSSKLVYNSDTLYEFERKGREQFEGFRNDQRSFYLPIIMNKFQIF